MMDDQLNNEIIPSTQSGNRIACSVCGRGLGRRLVRCSRRGTGECPFRLKRERFGWNQESVVVLLLGAIFVYFGIGAVWHLDRDGTENIFIALCCLVMGIPMLAAGLLAVIGIRTYLVDVENGLTWQQETMVGLPMSTRKVVQKEKIRIELPSEFGLKYPASCGAVLLYQERANRDVVVKAIMNAVVVLAARGDLDLFGVRVRHIEAPVPYTLDARYHIQAGTRDSGDVPMGTIEHKLLEFLWVQREFIDNKQGFASSYSWIPAFLAYLVSKAKQTTSTNVVEMLLNDCAGFGLTKAIVDPEAVNPIIVLSDEGRNELVMDLRAMHQVFNSIHGVLPNFVSRFVVEIEDHLSDRERGYHQFRGEA